MRIVMLCGGLASVRFFAELAAQLLEANARQPEPATLTGIINTGDDISLHGLRICPDLDEAMYSLAEIVGHRRPIASGVVAAELAAYGAQEHRFAMTDADIATYILRSHLLDVGFRLSVVTETLCARWGDLPARLIPMTEERVESHVIVDDGTPGGSAVHIQQWRHEESAKPMAFLPLGAEAATPAPGLLDALDLADLVLIAPGCPVTGIGPMLAIPGVAEAMRAAPCPVLGISPVIAGAMTSDINSLALVATGIVPTTEGIARHYGSRQDHDNSGGLLDGWLIDSVDADLRLNWIETHPVALGSVDVRGVAQLWPSPGLVRSALGLAAGVDW